MRLLSLSLLSLLPSLSRSSPLASSDAEAIIPRRQSSGTWTLVQNGTTAVAAMQLAIVSPTLAIIIDKVEHNAAQVNGHDAWGALFNLVTNQATPINIVSNSFCAGGTFISNGTLVSLGGNFVIDGELGDQDGYQGIRLFGPCTNPSGTGCTVFESPSTLHLVNQRWYPTGVRIYDGSAMVIGGTPDGSFFNLDVTDSSNYEFFPPKNGGVPIPSPFLLRAGTVNLFPIAFALPDGTIFMAANNISMIYNIQTNTETALPPMPNGVRISYPFSGLGVLLPLSPPNYTPEVLICGGTTASDSVDPGTLSSQFPASDQCVRMVLNAAGIAAGWKVEHMLERRVMPEGVLLPNGQIVIVNGGKTGFSGYLDVPDTIGESNADNPAFTPSLYTPSAAAGSRFTNAGFPTSSIARLYHSVATLTPSGNIMIAGSNPNDDVSTNKYATEYRVEFLNPPYMSVARPSMSTVPAKIGFNAKFNVTVSIPTNLITANMTVQLALMDLGFVTHAVHSQQRLVFLVTTLSSDHKTLTVTGPPNGMIYPPGPGWLYLTINGVSSQGSQVIVGSGGNPPVAFQ